MRNESFIIIKCEIQILSLTIDYKNASPQVQCTMLDAWGWCTGTTQRDGMGREEGGGFRMGNTCIIFFKLKLNKKKDKKDKNAFLL